MANNFMVGGAPKTPKGYTYVLSGTPTASGTTTVTINGKNVTLLAAASGETTATLAPKIVAALKDTGVPGEFKVPVWSYSGSTITAKGQSDGRPLVISAFTVAGATVTSSNNTSSSPYDISNPANWSLGALPTASDTAVADRDVPWLYGLDALAAIDCPVRRTSNHKSDIGLPDVHSKGFAEYLPVFLDVKSTTLNISDTGAGTVRLRAAIATTYSLNVTGSGTPSGEPLIEAGITSGLSVTWNVSAVSSGLTVTGGTLGTVSATNSNLRFPNLLSVTTVNSSGSRISGALTATTLNSKLGSTNEFLAGSSATTNVVNGSTVKWKSTGSAGALALGLDGVFDSSEAPGAFALTSVSIAKGAKLNDPNGLATKPFTITPNDAGPVDWEIDVGIPSTIVVN